MIKRVIHLGDVHVPAATRRHNEYVEVLNNFLKSAEEIVSENGKDETLILLGGDIFHNKDNITSNQVLIITNFLKSCDKICKTIVITGNHDLVVNNMEKLDGLSLIFKTVDLNNSKYLDLILDYKSGIIYDENIAWCLYSIFDDYKKPNILESKIDHPDKLHIGLFHGCLDGSELDSTHVLGGLNKNMFEGCDLVLMADIHKRQFIDLSGVTLCYCGSLHQNHFGESVSKHGFIEWNIEDPSDITYEEHDLEHLNEYGFYKFKINSIEEIEEGLEEFINF